MSEKLDRKYWTNPAKFERTELIRILAESAIYARNDGAGKLAEAYEQAATLIEQQARRIEELEQRWTAVGCYQQQLATAKAELYAKKVIIDGLKENLNALTIDNSDLKAELAYANDAAKKGDPARLAASGMEQEIKELKAELEDVKEQLRLLAEETVYRGNSVSWIYSKKDAYRKNIDDVNAALTKAGMVFDGFTSNVTLIERLAQQLTQAKGENERLRKALEGKPNETQIR